MSGILLGFSWLFGSTDVGYPGNERKKLICFIGVFGLGSYCRTGKTICVLSLLGCRTGQKLL